VAGGSVWASPAPIRSGQRRWRRVAIDAGTAAAGDALNSVACVAGQLCVAVDQADHVLSSRAITQPGSWLAMAEMPVGSDNTPADAQQCQNYKNSYNDLYWQALQNLLAGHIQTATDQIGNAQH
jgi:hypothetical protein